MEASSPQSVDAWNLVTALQSRFVAGLEGIAERQGDPCAFSRTEWLRDEGTHGGGHRYSAPEPGLFDRASVNVSQVHYEDLPEKKLRAATAISTIIHPRNPHAPSVHIHVSWTEMKDSAGYWRIMADLNPSVVHEEYRDRFAAALEEASPLQYEEAAAQGDRYFYIPALDRHRGVTHFYLESYHTNDPSADRSLAEQVGQAAIDSYLGILESALQDHPEIDEEARATQLAYHTLYLFQVLTLDRGTTSGLLVHDQNDVGIMGSLPSHVDRELLRSWRDRVESPQDKLVASLAAILPEKSPSPVDDPIKAQLAEAVRAHYRAHPEALQMQASGNVIPPTVENHR